MSETPNQDFMNQVEALIAHNESLQEKYNKTRDIIANLKETVSTLQSTLEDIADEKDNLRIENEDLYDQILDQDEIIHTLGEENKHLSESVSKLRKKLSKTKRKNISDILTKKDSEISELKLILSQLSEKIKDK